MSRFLGQTASQHIPTDRQGSQTKSGVLELGDETNQRVPPKCDIKSFNQRQRIPVRNGVVVQLTIVDAHAVRIIILFNKIAGLENGGQIGYITSSRNNSPTLSRIIAFSSSLSL